MAFCVLIIRKWYKMIQDEFQIQFETMFEELIKFTEALEKNDDVYTDRINLFREQLYELRSKPVWRLYDEFKLITALMDLQNDFKLFCTDIESIFAKLIEKNRVIDYDQIMGKDYKTLLKLIDDMINIIEIRINYDGK